jgi:hypothetical protein
MWMTIAGLFMGGCQTPVAQSDTVSPEVHDFTIQRIRLSALTDFVVSKHEPPKSELKTYVELLDGYDSQLKKPCTFRFELYEHQPLVANPRGKRLIIWPDVDLTTPAANQQYWKDYIRSYEFYLPLGFAPQPNRNYLLEVTCLTPEGRFNTVLKVRCQP